MKFFVFDKCDRCNKKNTEKKELHPSRFGTDVICDDCNEKDAELRSELLDAGFDEEIFSLWSFEEVEKALSKKELDS